MESTTRLSTGSVSNKARVCPPQRHRGERLEWFSCLAKCYSALATLGLFTNHAAPPPLLRWQYTQGMRHTLFTFRARHLARKDKHALQSHGSGPRHCTALP